MTEKLEQRTPDWFRARQNRITGSIAGALLGLSPFMSQRDAERRVLAGWRGDSVAASDRSNAALDWGVLNEPNAIAMFELETGHKVQRCGFYAYEDWLGASPDGLVGDSGLIEVKCPYSLRNIGQFKSITEQPHYMAQVQIQLEVTGRSHCYFFQWSPGIFRLETVAYDPFYMAEILPKLREIWERLQGELHAEPNAELEGLLKRYEKLTDSIADLSEERKEVLALMVERAKGRETQIGSRRLIQIQREGSVSYKQALDSLAPGVDLEQYRGKPTSYWIIK